MIFGKECLATFGNCKVQSWRSNIFTDFESKEISYRGQVIASVKVPTVRTIEATVIVKGKNAYEVDRKLEAIGKWLRESGSEKLFAERDTSHYYIARCTSVSKPERSGASARFTVTFTCSDNRLYSIDDNQPIESAASCMSNFTFAGKHCLNDMGCVFVPESIDALAQVKANKYEITGQSGTLRYDSGEGVKFSEKSLMGTLYFVKQSDDGLMNEDEINQKLHAVASWLGNAGRAQLILDSDVTRYCEAEIDGNQTLSRKDWENGSIKLKMTLQPYSCSVAQSVLSQTKNLGAGAANNVNLDTLEIGYVTPLIVEITNRSSTPITDLRIQYYNELNELKTMRLRYNGFSVSNGQKIVVNGLTGDISKGSENGIQWLDSGDFPVLSVNGTRRIRIVSSTAATVDVAVKCNARWL